ncbi:MAG: hypothetical protein HY070_11855 [Chloroflexi bacterium]|nr:hypothetical protein [Chloroflexota bacterium]
MLQAILKYNRPAVLGMIVLIPALLFEAIGISQFIARGNAAYQAFESFDALIGGARSLIGIIFQIVVVFGPLVALMLTIIPAVNVNIRREQKSLISTITIRGNLLNLAIIALSVLALAVMGTYIVAENWQCIVGLKVSC